MKKQREYINFIFIGFCALIASHISLSLLPSLRLRSNDLSYGYVYSLSLKAKRPAKIVGVAIDDYSLSKIPQRWPWRRPVYAEAIKILDSEKASTVGIDLIFGGESESKDDDLFFAESLKSVSTRVVLAYLFDYKQGAPVLPLPQLRESSYALGMLNTPQDLDGRVRRLRSYVSFNGNLYYSFNVALASSFLNQKPEEIISCLPLLKDRTFFINYQLKPKDILRVSFFELLNNLPGLKARYGDDFLKGALVLIYPEAAIQHDNHLTPLGIMPGGILHLNGLTNIISRSFLKEIDFLVIPFLLVSFVVIYHILKHSGLLLGLIFVLGVIFLQFWSLVLFGLKGIKFDYACILVFSLLFFILGSLYKYVYFLGRLLIIRNKATLDPVRNLFTLRYFYYRLELELKKIYLHKNLFLLFIDLGEFKKKTEEVSLDEVKDIWLKIRSIISVGKSFWSVYSPQEVVGCLVSSSANTEQLVNSLRNNLAMLLREKGIEAKLKLGYLKLKKEYPIRELLVAVPEELKKRDEGVIFLKESDLNLLPKAAYLKAKESVEFLDSLDQDIEEKNRQLLALVESLNKEYAKTKEAFFQIITSLVNALEARDAYSQGHSQRVCNYALKIAGKLGWEEAEKEKLRKASLLHDLGKIGIPDSILHKKGPLNEAEYDIIKKHEVIAVKILEPLKEIGDILPWILYHHERWDGQGYPHGLGGDNIPLASQIISLCDVFDALTTGRDYKPAFSYDDAIREIVKNKGTQFNPKLVDIFVEVIREAEK